MSAGTWPTGSDGFSFKPRFVTYDGEQFEVVFSGSQAILPDRNEGSKDLGPGYDARNASMYTSQQRARRALKKKNAGAAQVAGKASLGKK